MAGASDASRHIPLGEGTAASVSGVSALPVKDPTEDLPETGQRILQAARRVLSTRGLRGLTFAAIAEESGEQAALVAYYFGNKAGLVGALIALVHSEFIAAFPSRNHESASRDSDSVVRRMQAMSEPPEAFNVVFELLPYVLAHNEIRKQFSDVYKWYADLILDWMGLDRSGNAQQRDELRPLARVILALIDGLVLQALLDPEEFDLDQPYEFVGRLFQNSWADLVLLSEPSGAQAESPTPACSDRT